MAERNVVVIVADTWRDQRPLQGNQPSLMPFLDEFARDGLAFDHLMASSSWTAPSHVSLLKGADPWETHFHVPGAGRRAPTTESLADRWSKMGGVSAGFSANFLVHPQLGTATGYTRFNPGFPAGLAGVVQLGCTLVGYERILYNGLGGAGRAPSGSLARARASLVRGAGTGLYKSVNSMRTGETLLRGLGRFLRHRPTQAAPPLHLFCNIVEAHEPYLVGQNGGLPGAPITPGHLPSINFARFNDLLVSRQQPDPFLQAYRTSLTSADNVFRNMIGLLRRHGILDNAVLLFVSDHGQNLGEHNFYGHGFYVYDELVKVPGYLWEFRDGRPVHLEPPEPEWFDHRHLFDLLASAVPDGAPLDVPGTLSGSLLRRGPASSYYEGPGMRAPDGLVFKPTRPPTYRILRVQRGNETSVLRSDLQGGNVVVDSAESPDAPSDELAEIARHVLTKEIASAKASTGATTEMDSQVDARLKSWGYD